MVCDWQQMCVRFVDNWRFVTSAVLSIPHIAGTSELIDADRLGTNVITLEALQ